MNKIYEVWIDCDDMDSLLVGLATTEVKANQMKEKLIEQTEGAYEIKIIEQNTDELILDDISIKF